MKKLIEKKPILHAVLWIMIYIATVNIGDALSESTGAAYWTGILLLVLSVLLVIYLMKSSQTETYGIRKITKQDGRRTLFYAPLILLGCIQFFGGIEHTFTTLDIAIACLLMVGTGFLEELIFRGFLFQGICGKSGVNRAIFISGITFGIGHLVNLLRGYGVVETAGQIFVAIVVGIVLALLVAVTKALVPGILFHIIFNIGGTITNQNSGMQSFILLAIVAVSIPYGIYLYQFVHKQNVV